MPDEDRTQEPGEEVRIQEPGEKVNVRLPEGGQKGLDFVDTSIPAVDKFRPELDAPVAAPEPNQPETPSENTRSDGTS